MVLSNGDWLEKKSATPCLATNIEPETVKELPLRLTSALDRRRDSIIYVTCNLTPKNVPEHELP